MTGPVDGVLWWAFFTACGMVSGFGFGYLYAVREMSRGLGK